VSECNGPADLVKTPCTLHGDEPTECIAIVTHPPGETLIMTKLAHRARPCSRACSTTCQQREEEPPPATLADVEHRAWHFERVDGSFTRAGRSLFSYGVQGVGEVERVVRQFEAEGRIPRGYIPVGPSAPPHRAGRVDGARAFSTSAHPFAAGASAGYATLAEAPVPIVTTQARKKFALIGARGYTGRRSPRSSRRTPPSTFCTDPRASSRASRLTSPRWRPSCTGTLA
jgi:N-acetyl-gamma-glutamyl-phosphate reductase/acetylglutamate kinase